MPREDEAMLAPIAMPATLKDRIMRAAQRDGSSLSAWVRRVLAEKVGHKFRKGER